MAGRELLRAALAPELWIAGALLGMLGLGVTSRYDQADTASDVALAKSRLMGLEAALGAYFIDNSSYPLCNTFGAAYNNGVFPNQYRYLETLSTPIAYAGDVDTLVADPFIATGRISVATAAQALSGTPMALTPGDSVRGRVYYQSHNSTQRCNLPAGGFNLGPPYNSTAWIAASAGPDLTYHNIGGITANDSSIDPTISLLYDPTNGTVSFGSIYAGSDPITPDNHLYAAGLGLLTAIEASEGASGLPRETIDW